MLLVCPNCATSYGVEMASLRLARGGTRQVRCCRCRWVWHAQLSYADKLMVAADAVLPVRRAMLAVAQGVPLRDLDWREGPIRFRADGAGD